MKPKLRFKEFTDDWKEKKLGEIADCTIGLVTTMTSNYVENGMGTPLIRNSDIYENKLNPLDSLINLDNDFSQKNKNRKLNENDIITVHTGDIGTSAVITKEYQGSLSFAGLQTRLKKNINSYFISWYLNSAIAKKYFLRMSTGDGRTNLNLKDFKKLSIQLPSLSEQEKIGTFLGLVDQRIGKAEKKVSLLKEEKKGWMQKLFQQEIRFKDEQGNDYPDWEEYAIQEIYKITRGKVLAKNKVLENGSYPVYSSQTLNNGLLGYYDEYLFENSITWTTDGANAGTVNFRKGKFYCTNVCGVLLNEKGYSNKCMAEILNSVAYRYVSKVGNPKLMNNVIAEISIQFPSLSEQEKIANFLSLLDQRIEKEERKVELLKEEKKGLLQNMFV